MIIHYAYKSRDLNRRYETDAVEMTIGRDAERATLVLFPPDRGVSSLHARITHDDDGYFIEDLGSTNGTALNGELITARTRLRPGDRIQAGDTFLEVEIPIPPMPIETDSDLPDGLLSSQLFATESPADLIADMAADAIHDMTRHHLRVFFELDAALGGIRTLEDLAEIVVEHLRKAIPSAERGGIVLQNGMQYFFPEDMPPSISTTLFKRAVTERISFIWEFSTLDPTRSQLEHQTQSAMYAPLLWRGEKFGVLYLDNRIKARSSFIDNDLRLMTAIANQTATLIKNHLLDEELRHQELIRANLLRQFSPRVAEHLLQTRGALQIGGKRVSPVTILESDIRGYTALSSKIDVNQVMSVLNEMFSELIPIIFRYDGTVDKYIGDAILVVFGSPVEDDDQWNKAVLAALEMQAKMAELNEKFERILPDKLEIGIGIHTGEVMHGFIGSSERMEYTVIGDTVNRTARLCSAAGRGEVLVSHDVYRRVEHLFSADQKDFQTKHDTDPDKSGYVIRGKRSDS